MPSPGPNWIYTPPGVVHAYVIESDEAHLIGVAMSDGRFHRLQTQAPPLFATEGGPDIAAITALAASCDVDLLGPRSRVDTARDILAGTFRAAESLRFLCPTLLSHAARGESELEAAARGLPLRRARGPTSTG